MASSLRGGAATSTLSVMVAPVVAFVRVTGTVAVALRSTPVATKSPSLELSVSVALAAVPEVSIVFWSILLISPLVEVTVIAPNAPAPPATLPTMVSVTIEVPRLKFSSTVTTTRLVPTVKVMSVVWPAAGAAFRTKVSEAPPFRLVTVKVLVPLSYVSWKASPVVPESTRTRLMPVNPVRPVVEVVAAPLNSAASTSGTVGLSRTDISIGGISIRDPLNRKRLSCLMLRAPASSWSMSSARWLSAISEALSTLSALTSRSRNRDATSNVPAILLSINCSRPVVTSMFLTKPSTSVTAFSRFTKRRASIATPA